MEHKKSVILYVDIISTFEALEDDEAGRLIKHYLRYVNDLNPVAPDRITAIAFEPIKQQLKRDLVKWERERVERTKAGHIGGIKSGEVRRKQKEAKEASALKLKQKEAKEAVNVNVTVTDTVNVNESKDARAENFQGKSEIKEGYLEKELKNSFSWLEQNCRTFRIDLPAVNKFLDQFISEQKAADNFNHREFSDLKSHFAKWLKIEISKPKEKQGSGLAPHVAQGDYRKLLEKQNAKIAYTTGKSDKNFTE